MFYQIFVSPQLKRWAIITYKHGIYELPHELPNNLKLKKSDKYFALSNLSIYYAWKNIRKSYKNNQLKISASTWNKEFELPDGSYSVSDIQDYFKYIFKYMR